MLKAEWASERGIMDSSVQLMLLVTRFARQTPLSWSEPGFSFEAGMPLSGQLAPLVWHAPGFSP